MLTVGSPMNFKNNSWAAMNTHTLEGMVLPSPFRSEPIEWVIDRGGVWWKKGKENEAVLHSLPRIQSLKTLERAAELVKPRLQPKVTVTAKIMSTILNTFLSLPHYLLLYNFQGQSYSWISLSAFLFLKCQNLYAHSSDLLVPKPLKMSSTYGINTPQASSFNYSSKTR